MAPRVDSGVNDRIRGDLEENHPLFHIEDTQLHCDLSVFNQAAQSDKVLLTIECWQDVHPGLVTIPVEWDYEIPYGLLYSADSAEDVLHFVECVKKIKAQNER